MNGTLERIRRLIVKEFIQTLRDPHARFGLIVPPIIQMLVFGYAASYTVRHVATAILDQDHSQESRELAARFWSSAYFDVGPPPADAHQIDELIDHRRITMAVRIMPGFSEQLRKGGTAPVQVILDGTNSNTALVALSYVVQITQRYSAQYLADHLARVYPAGMQMPSIELIERPWFNPDLDSRWFFVPGTIAALTMVLVVTMTAFAVVREREIGTLEQIMVTPIRPFEMIAGKTIPYVAIALVQVAVVTAVAIVWFQVPFRGSFALLLLGSIAFIFSVLGAGLSISTLSATQQQALVTAFFLIMPNIILSGFAFPIDSMPHALQLLTYLDPMRYYLIILRDCFLKGNGVAILWPQLAALFVLGAVLLTVSVLRFHKSLE
jgi:ABC-2 type transport system permease protein